MPTPITVLLSGLPVRTMDQTAFDLAAAQLMTDLPTWGGQVNALTAALNALAAGTAYAIPYTFSTTTTDADPGAGFLRLSSATQNTSTVIRTDLFGSDTADWTSVLDDLDASSSGIKGQIRLVKLTDPSKWLTFKLTARATPSGYRNLTVIPVSSSSASPFANNDLIIMLFTRTGDVGANGSVVWRTITEASNTAPATDINNYDMHEITALTGACTVGAPTGTLTNGRRLAVTITDNGTARALAFNSVFRFSPNLPAPTTTLLGKTLYMGFIYRTSVSKWDMVAFLDNF